MEEEVGIDRSHVDILGTLPEYRTGSGYRVTPVVSIVTPPFVIHTNPDEVAEVTPNEAVKDNSDEVMEDNSTQETKEAE